MAPILAFASQAFGLVPSMIQAGMALAEILEFVTAQRNKVQEMNDQGRKPTPEEWDSLNAVRDQVHQRIQDS
jgi:hypothetical protein